MKIDLCYQLIAEKLRLIRERRGLTQEEAAKRCAILRTSLCNIEAGRTRVSINLLYVLAGIYDVNIRRIIP